MKPSYIVLSIPNEKLPKELEGKLQQRLEEQTSTEFNPRYQSIGFPAPLRKFDSMKDAIQCADVNTNVDSKYFAVRVEKQGTKQVITHFQQGGATKELNEIIENIHKKILDHTFNVNWGGTYITNPNSNEKIIVSASAKQVHDLIMQYRDPSKKQSADRWELLLKIGRAITDSNGDVKKENRSTAGCFTLFSKIRENSTGQLYKEIFKLLPPSVQKDLQLNAGEQAEKPTNRASM